MNPFVRFKSLLGLASKDITPHHNFNRQQWATFCTPSHNIVLTGAPGSGKSTLARMLAAKLDWKVIDVDDDVLEPFWGMPVSQKANQLAPQGYQAILKAESEAFRQFKVDKSHGYVIALSGSIPLCEKSRQHIRTLGRTIYVDVSPQDIIKRLGVMKVDRIFKHRSNATIEEVLLYRSQFYEKIYDYRALVAEGCDPDEAFDYVYKCVQRMMNRPELFVSTRNTPTEKPNEDITPIDFNDVVTKSVAPDKGLYCPKFEIEPFDPEQLRRLESLSWVDLVLRVQEKLIDPIELQPQLLHKMITESYKSFADPTAPVKIVSLSGDCHIAELFHGPTASFKDFPLQQLPHFYHHAINRKNSVISNGEKILILVATSGDTGGATLDAFERFQRQMEEETGKRNSGDIELMVLYPFGNVSSIQEKQMMQYHSPPLREVYGVDANFDQCQQTVKMFFNQQSSLQSSNESLNRKYFLCAANSVNWGRIVGQISMHFGVYFQLVKDGIINSGDSIDYSIPTGNFGNIYSAYMAKRMGVPFRRLIMASNENNVLSDFVHSGIFDNTRKMVATMSTAIDILKPSNLERFLFEVCDRNGETIKQYYEQCVNDRVFKLTDREKEIVQSEIKAGFCWEEQCVQTQEEVLRKFNYDIDPHTAVALHVGSKNQDHEPQTHVPLVTLSTAHPMKFRPASSIDLDTQLSYLNHPKLHRELKKTMKRQQTTHSHSLQSIVEKIEQKF